MAIDLAALKTEAQLPKYSGFSPQQVAADLNRRTIAADQDVEITLIKRQLVGTGVYGAVCARRDWLRGRVEATAAAGSAEEERLALLSTVIGSLELPSFTMTNVQSRAFVNGFTSSLAVEGVMTTAQRTQFLSLANGNISRAEELFGRGEWVEPGHVALALAS